MKKSSLVIRLVPLSTKLSPVSAQLQRYASGRHSLCPRQSPRLQFFWLIWLLCKQKDKKAENQKATRLLSKRFFTQPVLNLEKTLVGLTKTSFQKFSKIVATLIRSIFAKFLSSTCPAKPQKSRSSSPYSNHN